MVAFGAIDVWVPVVVFVFAFRPSALRADRDLGGTMLGDCNW
jgi:hypothetical protein